MSDGRRAVRKSREPEIAAEATAVDRVSLIRIKQNAIVTGLAAATVLMLVVDLILQTIDDAIESDNLVWVQIVRLFDLNSESSIPTWYSVIMLFTASLVALAIAISRKRMQDTFSWHWFLFALLIFVFSLDESAQIHDAPSREPLRDIVGTGGLLYFPWVVVAVVAALIVGVLSINFLRYLPRRTARLLIISASIFGTGAIGLEMVSGWYLDQDSSSMLIAETISSFEEFFELAGVVVLIYALLDYAGSHIGATRIVWR